MHVVYHWYSSDISLILSLYRLLNMKIIYQWYINPNLKYIIQLIFWRYIRKEKYQWYIRRKYIIFSRYIKVQNEIRHHPDISNQGFWKWYISWYIYFHVMIYHDISRWERIYLGDISMIYHEISPNWYMELIYPNITLIYQHISLIYQQFKLICHTWM